MKKPKSKLSNRVRNTVLPGPLVVDYGLDRVVMPFRVSLENYYTTEFAEIELWCDDTFGNQGWRRSGVWPGYIHFEKEKYITMFLIRWPR